MAQATTPREAIESLDMLLASVDGLRAELAAEIKQIQAQWVALGRLGGQRDDAAADLMSKLEFPLVKLRDFCRDCHRRIGHMHRDPFGRRNGLPPAGPDPEATGAV